MMEDIRKVIRSELDMLVKSGKIIIDRDMRYANEAIEARSKFEKLGQMVAEFQNIIEIMDMHMKINEKKLNDIKGFVKQNTNPDRLLSRFRDSK